VSPGEKAAAGTAAHRIDERRPTTTLGRRSFAEWRVSTYVSSIVDAERRKNMSYESGVQSST